MKYLTNRPKRGRCVWNRPIVDLQKRLCGGELGPSRGHFVACALQLIVKSLNFLGQSEAKVRGQFDTVLDRRDSAEGVVGSVVVVAVQPVGCHVTYLLIHPGPNGSRAFGEVSGNSAEASEGPVNRIDLLAVAECRHNAHHAIADLSVQL